LVAMVLVLALVAIMPAQASSGGHLFSPSSHPFGNSFSEWNAKWWQWSVQQTSSTPCPTGQSGKVWFLFGSDPAPTFYCTVPAGTGLLIPIINAEWSAAEGPCGLPISTSAAVGSEDYLRACAKAYMNGVTHLQVIVDGVTLLDAPAAGSPYRVGSKQYTLNSVTNNMVGVPPGPNNKSVADGFYAMLQPMSKGEHTVRFLGTATIAGTPYAPGGIYHITVK
jgi:hypothetical protein